MKKTLMFAAVVLMSVLHPCRCLGSWYGDDYECDGRVWSFWGPEEGTVITGASRHPGRDLVVPSTVVAKVPQFVGARLDHYEEITVSVAMIGREAFKDVRDDFQTVVIPQGVTNIGAFAFAFSGVQTVSLPAGLKSISQTAFGASDLKNVVIPDSVSYVAGGAFSECRQLRSARLPSGIREILSETFENCTSLVSVTLCEGVERIGRSAFAGCVSLKEIVIPSTVSLIDNGAFYQAGLMQIRFDGPPPQCADYVFWGVKAAEGYCASHLTEWSNVVDPRTGMWNGIHFAVFDPACCGETLRYHFKGLEDQGDFDPQKAHAVAFKKDHSGGTIQPLEIARASSDEYLFLNGGDGEYVVFFEYDGDGWTCATEEDVVTVPGDNAVDHTVYFRRTACEREVEVMFDPGKGSMPPRAPRKMTFSSYPNSNYVVIYGEVLPQPCPPNSAMPSLYAWKFDGWYETHSSHGNFEAPVKITREHSILFDSFVKSLRLDVKAKYSRIWWLYPIRGNSGRVEPHAYANDMTLKTAFIPDDVMSVGMEAFRGCVELGCVSMASNVTQLSDGAFSGCSNLTNLFFEGNAPACGNDVFKDVPSTCVIYVAGGSTGWDDDGDGLWQGLRVRVVPDDLPESAEDGGHLYMVIDLSDGPTATRYPVTYLDAVPAEGWSESYKTEKLVLRRVDPGTFWMGSPDDENGRAASERMHQVRLTKGFYIGVFEVTQRQWELVTGKRPSLFSLDACYAARPVECVSYEKIRGISSGDWRDSATVHPESFVGLLRAKCGLQTIDLPTEAQWEYACRAGTATALHNGKKPVDHSKDAGVDEIAVCCQPSWYGPNSDIKEWDASKGSAVVGSRVPNAWGLYDMIGNVSEWCVDWFEDFTEESKTDPVGASSGTRRVRRGTNWWSPPLYNRAARRSHARPAEADAYTGFRIGARLERNVERSIVLRFDPNQGQMAVVSQEYEVGRPCLSLPLASRDGYLFSGWHTQPAGGTLISSEDATRAETDMLYAHWVLEKADADKKGLAAILDNFRWEHELTRGFATVTRLSHNGYQVPDVRLEHEWHVAMPAVLSGGAVTSIAARAFSTYTARNELRSMSLPETLVSIGEGAFQGCTNLVSLYFKGDVPHGLENAGIDPAVLFFVKPEYDDSWRAFGHDVVVVPESYAVFLEGRLWRYRDVEGGVQIFNSYDTAVNPVRGKVLVPETIGGRPVVGIGRNALYEAEQMTGVDIPSSVCSIEPYAFSKCDGLSRVIVPEGVTNVGAQAFSSCGSLQFVSLPSTLESIGVCSFGWCNNLSEVRISDGPHTIEYGAFNLCQSLCTIRIPKSVTNVADMAFAYCSRLSSLVFEGDAPVCGKDVFISVAGNCEVYVRAGSTGWDDDGDGLWQGLRVRVLADDDTGAADEMCDGVLWRRLVCADGVVIMSGEECRPAIDPLTEGCVNVPERLSLQPVTELGDYAFFMCQDVLSLTIPSSVTEVGTMTFEGCVRLCSVFFKGGVPVGLDASGLSMWVTLFVTAEYEAEWREAGYDVVVVPDNGAALVDGRLWYYRDVTDGVEVCNGFDAAVVPLEGEVLVPESIGGRPVVKIGDYAFRQASWTSFEIGRNVREISPSAFAYVGNATDVILAPENPSFVMRNGVLYNTAQTHVYFCNRGAMSVSLPNTVRTFSYSVFQNCPWLKSIAFPDGIVELQGEQMFYGSGLESVAFPKTLRKIGFSVFCWCPKLMQVDLPESLVEIDNQAFLSCSLRSVRVPDGVVRVGVNAFMGCTNLVDVTFGKGIREIDTAAFMYCPLLAHMRFEGDAPTVGTMAFDGLQGKCVVEVGREATGWDDDGDGLWQGMMLQRGALSPVLATYGPFVPGEKVEEKFPDGAAWKVTGLPTGLKWDAKLPGVTGVPTKPGTNTVTFTWTDKSVTPNVTHKASATFIVGPLPVLSVLTAGEGTGKVSGAGAYAANKKVTLKATADTKDAVAKGKNPATVKSVFAGWYDAAGDLVAQTPSLSYVMPPHDVALQAGFIPASNDWATVDCVTEAGSVWVVSNETKVAITPISVVAAGGSQPTVKVAGLPTGLKFTAKDIMKKNPKTEVDVPANTIYGTPTKGGVYNATVTVTTAGKASVVRAIKFIIRTASDYVVDADWDPVQGKVTGAGVYQADKKVTLKATANKGYVFSGWWPGGAAGGQGLAALPAGEPVSRLASYVLTMPTNDVAYVAAFVTAAEDVASIGATVNGFAFGAGTEDSDGGVVTQLATNVMAGVYLEWPVAASALSATTVKVAGLPSGLKFDAKANTIYGAPTAASKVDGKTGNVKPSEVKVTVTTAGRNKQVYQIDTTVDPLPSWAVGTFAGPSYDGGRGATALPDEAVDTNGIVTITIATSGKITAKQPVDGKSTSFAANYFDVYDGDSFWATLTAKVGKEIVTNEMVVNGHAGRVTLPGGSDAAVTNGVITADRFDAWQCNWKAEPWKTIGKTFDKEELSYETDNGTVTLKFSANGTAKVTGEFTDASGKVVRASGSATLLPTVGDGGETRYLVFVYLAPKGLAPYARCLEVGGSSGL